MPEILLRMKIGATRSLKELQDAFNSIMNSIAKRSGPLQPGTAALVMYPEIFQEPRDEYLYALLRKIAEEEGKNLSVPLEE